MTRFSRTLIAAHRGVAGGDIPGNTPEALTRRCVRGGRELELDVSNTADSESFVFHPGMEPVFLHSKRYLEGNDCRGRRGSWSMSTAMARPERSSPPSTRCWSTLKDRCYINVDKFPGTTWSPSPVRFAATVWRSKFWSRPAPDPAAADWLEQKNAPGDQLHADPVGRGHAE